MNRIAAIYSAAIRVAVFSALVATTTVGVLAIPVQWAHLHGDVVVPVSELSRLASCDQAVRAAERYDVARARGGNADGELSAYWFAKAQCNATTTVKAAR